MATLVSPPPVHDPDLAQWFIELYGWVRNHEGEVINVTDTGTADTEFAVEHTLGRIPRYAEKLISENDTVVADIVYRSTTAWTRTHVYLRCNAANSNVTIRVF